jgi:AcrR family transcriptional regulator
LPKISTKDKLIAAAQDLLADKGLAAFNSNAIVERAGVTPPTFYHYFANKQALLRELGERLMLAQSEVLRRDTGLVIKTAEDFRAACEVTVRQSYAQTRAFKGSYALLVSLRALPELRDVRLNSHVEMAQLISRFLYNQGLSDHVDARIAPARLALEFLYAMIEMLFETDFANEEEMLRLTVNTHFNLYRPK